MFDSFYKKLQKMKAGKEEVSEVTFKEYDEEVVAGATEEKVIDEPKKAAPAMTAHTGDERSNIELKVVRPATFEEVSYIADYLLDGCTVVLNMELLDMPSTLRMLDFLNGVTYSTDGEIKNVSKSTYIITPNNVDVSDDK